MADAKIRILGEDKTQQAFASVHNSLTRLHGTAQKAGSGIFKAMDLRHAMTSVAVAVGLSVDKIADKIARLYTGTSEEQEKMQADALALQSKLAGARAENAGANDSSEQRVKKLTAEYERLGSAIKAGHPNEFGSEEYNNFLEKQIRYEEVINQLRSARGEQARVEGEYKDAMEKLGVAQGRIYAEQIPLEEKLIGLRAKEGAIMNDLAVTAIDDYKSRTRAAMELADVESRISDIIAEQAREALEKTRIYREAGEMLAYGFEDAIFAGEHLRDVIKQLGLDILRLMFRESFTKPWASSLGTAITGMFRADGGPVNSGSPYIVGENGPELFVPSGSGRVMNSGQVAGARGGGSGPVMNFIYNIAAGVTRSDLKPILDQQRAQLRAEIPDMVRRGGSYRTAFA